MKKNNQFDGTSTIDPSHHSNITMNNPSQHIVNNIINKSIIIINEDVFM